MESGGIRAQSKRFATSGAGQNVRGLSAEETRPGVYIEYVLMYSVHTPCSAELSGRGSACAARDFESLPPPPRPDDVPAMFRLFLVLLVAGNCQIATLPAEDWPQWR